MSFPFLVWQDSDLRSALLLEQAAHCFINMKQPMVRKYSFHMILAGHRFSKAAQVGVILALYLEVCRFTTTKLEHHWLP